MKHAPLAALFLLAAAGFSDLHAREYDPRIGRFVQREPLLEKVPSEHYRYASLQPLCRVDPTGAAAWVHTSYWDSQAKQKYQNYVQSSVFRYKGTTEDCADTSMTLLIEFAAQNGLPLTFEDNAGRWYISKSTDFSTKGDFLNKVLRRLGAKALFLHNTTPSGEIADIRTMSPADVKPGDLLLNAGHAALVFNVTQAGQRHSSYYQFVRNPDPDSNSIIPFPGHAVARTQQAQLMYWGPTLASASWTRDDMQDVRFDYLNHRGDGKEAAELIFNRSSMDLQNAGLAFRTFASKVFDNWDDWDGYGTPPWRPWQPMGPR